MSIEKFVGNFSKEDSGVSILVNSTIQLIKDGNALAIYCYLLTKPDNWKINPRELMHHFNWGKDRVYGSLNKLIDLNLLSRTEHRDHGKIVAYDYTLYLKPHAQLEVSPLPDLPDTVLPEAVNPDYTKQRELKNKDNIKPLISPLKLSTEDFETDNPFAIPIDLIEEWRANRKRFPVTKTVWNRINRVLQQLRERGINPLDAFERMVANGWRSIEVSWFEQEIKAKSTNQEVDLYAIGWGENIKPNWAKR